MTTEQKLIRSLASLLAATLLCATAIAAPVTGVVTNRTNNKPAAGDDVVLLQLAQGMQELARTKTDSRGRFSIEVPADGLHLLRVTHDKANYFKPIQPGTQSVEIDVYTAAADVAGVALEADVMRIETEAGDASLKVTEHFFVKNASSPEKTLMSDHPFELYLPAGATVEGVAAKSPGGMAVQQSLVPEGEANKFTVIFPLRPGETEFQVTYKLPYNAKSGLQIAPRPITPTDTLALMLPKSMVFKPATPAIYTAVTDEEPGAQTWVARNVQPSEPVAFNLSGSGQLPRDTVNGPQTADGSGQPGTGPATGQSSGTDTRPGGGLGTPGDKDAERDPWTKYRWWIIAGLGLALVAAAAFMLRTPSTPAATGPASSLQALRDEMFALETDKLSGKVSPEDYAELKAAYDLVLKRAIARSGPPV